MNVNTKVKVKLSLSSLHNFREILEKKKNDLPQISANIVNRVAEEIAKKSYEGTYVEKATLNIDKVVAKVKNNNPHYTYQEFGTGIIGAEKSHPIAADANWKYDVNNHGEKGWIYFGKDGNFHWTKGVPAKKRFYNAVKSAKRKLRDIAIDEFKKYGR